MSDDDDEAFERIANGLADAVLMSWIGDGTLAIEGKSAEEVQKEFVLLARQKIAEGYTFPVTQDHRPRLLKNAARSEAEKDLTLAVLLKMTWVEHWVNGMIDYVTARQDLSNETASVLIRELRLRSKMTAAWEILDLPEIPAEHIAAVDELSKHRNHFVHYKWRGEGDDAVDLVLKALRRADAAIEYFQQLEEQVLYGGRSSELSIFRQPEPPGITSETALSQSLERSS
ncbi:hypothetical protein [Catellatospora citrea]|uniref:Uncharacterized protein n=1 Tax=Catellatospora citrea TaxID=53366 RepID=A0A8J3P1Q9_9ACTN|nr:hypothetical protein [Catellatospora citrea]RKE12322.1 hypothetical protein C8E86_7260 [Catellatospora citrea]GIG00829.1 hypothetical protein Cci01nite_59220 [Catellatospora citrea]